MAELFTDTIRSISDFNKSPIQLAVEYTLELNYLSSFLPGSTAYTNGVPNDYARFLLGITRKYSTHEQIMAAKNPMLLVPEGKVLSFKETLGPVFHVIAGVIAYVPGFGTAAAFVLNAATSLAEGAPISEATLSAVRGALPGQPISTAAFDVTVSIAKGEPIEYVGISLLPIDEESKEYIKLGARVIRGLAEGQPVTTVTLDEIYTALPSDGRHAMEIAGRAARGENVGDIAIDEAAAAVRNAGEQAINEFVAKVGYQEMLDRIPGDIKNAIDAATALAFAMNAQGSGQTIAPTLSLGRQERAADKTRNDGLVITGRRIIATDFDLSTIRALPTYGIQRITNDEWRRGFDIGIAIGEGNSMYGPGQKAVRDSLLRIPLVNGFDSALELQYERTKQKTLLKGLDAMAMTLGRVASATDRKLLESLNAQGDAIANAEPQVAAARMLNSDPRYRWGYNIGSAIAKGSSMDGPGQMRIRSLVGPIGKGTGLTYNDPGSNEALSGFNVGQALQHGITKALAAGDSSLNGTNPTVAAGNLVTQGLAGGTQSAEMKALTMKSVAGNPLARQGAQTAIAKIAADQDKSLWTKFLEFFGLA
jgi:hypothetical protein